MHIIGHRKRNFLSNFAPGVGMDNEKVVAEACKSENPLPRTAEAFLAPLDEIKPPKVWRWTPLTAISVDNFKAIDKARIPLGKVTVLVGPNGSGKSSVLQAIHWAARTSSYIAPKNAKEMIAFERIDYLPSSEPLRTAFKGELRSEKFTRPTKISFQYSSTGTDESSAPTTIVNIWAARNKGGVTVHIEGGATVTPFKQRTSFITAYIPGLAGLSEKETILAQTHLRRQAANGDAGGVLRNVLLNLSVKQVYEKTNEEAKERHRQLNEFIQAVHPGVSIQVYFDEREDFNISATYRDSGLSSDSRSLETAATGVLQVVQIFAYLILFRPKLLLIDEPDAHLHPDKQERLIEALERAAHEFDAQIILTTHSPHVVRAASGSISMDDSHPSDQIDPLAF
jgi:ABC-type lipoprotein export system ATPase subunit